ncbi:hypothetical protein ASD11_07020 [Aeromicrobium sp. Root495]|uniref:hypothetical protein n=1 Tax=Aeromicrobium sp. Root495 TaxID=1736550 RepID=UPI0007003B93|nr:hypothetical protein [Aeromicrobium sp. Root495]KQY59319.1 hypothetical protein ASD11_07020 [Aeromicrobium sp. Root495]
MSAESAWVRAAAERLRGAGYRDTSLHVPEATALRRADFRVSWFLTRLHTFVLLVTPGPLDVRRAAELVAEGVGAAKRAKGGLPLGFQTGLAALTVVVVDEATDDLRAWFALRPAKMFGAFPLALLVETSTGRVTTYTGDVYWGSAYQSFLAEQQHLVTGDAGSAALGGAGGGRGQAITTVYAVVFVLAILMAFAMLVLLLVR